MLPVILLSLCCQMLAVDALENVAYKKRPGAEGRWVDYLTNGDLREPFAPWPIEFPYYYVDLGGVYNLISINIHMHDVWSF
ncbi:hypothetical protein CRM22_002033 [Opisthorchis felineus]|uniref:Uncharacterized protein n=1 Tax=Opisthorchis felineus TaxID=147828 RepID=A0A4S2MDW7_OPIFE|nr:hypothetical protein CRM22_002033 [Opisthorchis felineus]